MARCRVVYSGALPPEALEFDVPTENGRNLSTVTSGYLKVKFQNETEPTVWACTIAEKTSTLVRLLHVFADGETARPGKYVAVAFLVDPTEENPIRSQPDDFWVLEQFQKE